MIEFKPPLSQLVKDLDEFEDNLKVKAVRSGLTRAAKPIKTTMAALAPKDRQGRIAKAIGQKNISARAGTRLNLWTRDPADDSIQPGQVATLIGPNRPVNGKRWARLAAWSEFGTKPHTIRPKRHGFLTFAGVVRRQEVRHPGIKATEFMSRALEQNASSIPDLFYQGLSSWLDKTRKSA